MKTILPTLFLIVLLTSCGRKVTFLPSTTMPSATGVVKVKEDKNDNYTVRLNVTNLASPERLTPARDSYFVWAETEENKSQNLGKLRSKKGLFSKAWKGELETVSAEKPVRVFITAEDEASPQYPGEIIMNTKLFNVD